MNTLQNQRQQSFHEGLNGVESFTIIGYSFGSFTAIG